MSLQFFLGNSHTNQCSSLCGMRDVHSAADQFGTLTHTHQADAPGSISIWRVRADESFAVVFHFQFKGMRQKFKANPRLGNTGVAANVVKRFLNDAIEMNARAGVYWERLAGFFVVQMNALFGVQR